jgi:hypothetical protein
VSVEEVDVEVDLVAADFDVVAAREPAGHEHPLAAVE